MGQITIFFGGVCVFFEGYSEVLPVQPNPPIRRMVLVNADISSLKFGDFPAQTVYPHSALFTPSSAFTVIDGTFALPPRIPLTDDYDLNIGGVYTITVDNPLVTPWVDNAACLPHLRDGLPPGVDLGPPSLEVLRDGQAACYVDFRYGTITGNSIEVHPPVPPAHRKHVESHRMGIAVVTVPTDGRPRLRFTTPDPVFNSTLLFADDDAVVSITNKPQVPSTDDPHDFLLNYITCETAFNPDEISPPAEVVCPLVQGNVPSKIQHMDAGPGCSNTNFP